jgi:hypothetical protein
MEDSLVITVVGAAGTLAQGFTFDGTLCACAWVLSAHAKTCVLAAPVASAAPKNTPTSIGTWFTVTGLNFAATDASPSTQLQGTACVTTVWSSATSVACSPDIDQVDSGYLVTVTVGALVGSSVALFSFDGAFC